MLSKEAIDEFKKLYLQEYGVRLTDSQATDCGLRLIRLVKAVYGRYFPPCSVDSKAKKRNNGNELK